MVPRSRSVPRLKKVQDCRFRVTHVSNYLCCILPQGLCICSLLQVITIYIFAAACSADAAHAMRYIPQWPGDLPNATKGDGHPHERSHGWCKVNLRCAALGSAAVLVLHVCTCFCLMPGLCLPVGVSNRSSGREQTPRVATRQSMALTSAVSLYRGVWLQRANVIKANVMQTSREPSKLSFTHGVHTALGGSQGWEGTVGPDLMVGPHM